MTLAQREQYILTLLKFGSRLYKTLFLCVLKSKETYFFFLRKSYSWDCLLTERQHFLFNKYDDLCNKTKDFHYNSEAFPD